MAYISDTGSALASRPRREPRILARPAAASSLGSNPVTTWAAAGNSLFIVCQDTSVMAKKRDDCHHVAMTLNPLRQRVTRCGSELMSVYATRWMSRRGKRLAGPGISAAQFA